MNNRRNSERRRILLLAFLVALLAASCSRRQEPRSVEEIFREELQLPAVYLTAQTNQRVLAPGGKGAFVHEKTGELCWPALACLRPDCPGRSSDGQPQLFIAPDPSLFVQSDGTISMDRQKMLDTTPHHGQCPECWEQRTPDRETAAQRQQFLAWVKPYELPETAARRKELEDERRQRLRMDRNLDLATDKSAEDAPD